MVSKNKDNKSRDKNQDVKIKKTYSNVSYVNTERPPPPADCPLPVLRKCDAIVPAHLSPVHTWVETLGQQDAEPLGLAQLHPDVFAVPPRSVFISRRSLTLCALFGFLLPIG